MQVQQGAQSYKQVGRLARAWVMDLDSYGIAQDATRGIGGPGVTLFVVDSSIM